MFKKIWFGLFIVSCFSCTALGFEVPAVRSHVNDRAGVISRSVEQSLNKILAAAKSQRGLEMAILTVDSLGGEPIEQVSIQVTDQWKLGTAQADKGVLLLISMKDRKLRIEVGQGLEGDLTDAESRRIIDQTIVPMFRAGEVNKGIFIGAYQILKTADPDGPYEALFENPPQAIQRGDSSLGGKIKSILVFIFIMIFVFGRTGLLPLFLLAGMGGGGRGYRGGLGGGSFGGGGFGGGIGGGGGFSGGGASGGW